MYKIGDSYIVSDPVLALNWYRRGVDLAWGLDEDILAIRGLVKKSHAELNQKEYVQALNSSLNVLRYDVQLSDTIKSHLYTNIGDALTSLNAYELALEYRNKLLSLDSSKMSIFDQYYLTENIGYCHSRMGNLDSANYYYNLSMNLAESTLDTNLILHCFNNLGYHFFQNRYFENSNYYFNRGIDIFHSYSQKEKRDSVIYAMILVNRSDYLRKDNQLSAAKDEIYKSNSFLKGSDSTYYSGNVLRLFSMYLIEKQLDSCEKYMNLSNMFTDDPKFKEDFLQNSIEYYRLVEDNEKERFTISSLIKLLKNQKNHSANKMFIELIETQDEQIRKNLIKETELIKEEGALEKSRMLWIISLLAVLFLIGLIVFLIWRKKKREIDLVKMKLKEQEISIGKMKQQELSKQIEFKNQDLTEFGIELSLKNNLLQDVLEKLKQSDSKYEEVNEVVKLIEQHKQVDESLSVFHDNVEKVNYEFMNKLALNYPNLTANDRQICAMLKLQLTSKEIATLKNISTDSVKKIRYRLRKKMNLAPKEDLFNFFRNY